MPKSFLDEAQQQRSDQLFFTHKALSSVQGAATEAVRQYDKYVKAVEKVISTILENSDCIEEMRQSLGPRGEALIPPTFEATSLLFDSFTAWKSSADVKNLRSDLEALADLSCMAKRSVKLAEKSSADLAKAAHKAANFNTKEMERKISDASASRQKRLKAQQDEVNEQARMMDTAVVESMLSLGSWWSKKLIVVAEGLYRSYRDTAAASTAPFPSLPPAMRSAGELVQPPPYSLQPQAQSLTESSPPTSQSNRPSERTDPNAPMSANAPFDSASSRLREGTETGSANRSTHAAVTHPTGTNASVANTVPFSVMATAERRDSAGVGALGASRDAAYVVPPPMAGVPLVSVASEHQQNRCHAD
ncbi:hypothetical protein ABL78_6968 [Leptomonas seymouri]|uniref:BAR domain-containing protein n=1 Tax=Leptomonas seymouri TaxID=5684 RepID=A0A0N1PCN3_LEPSE|nr:hypothetical protein ABL78_6968 [Leptomonas seymouri]|eukprot:KPI83993.1 hypothetical protein ABL78_6968 [Leptomonas seymouri]